MIDAPLLSFLLGRLNLAPILNVLLSLVLKNLTGLHKTVTLLQQQKQNQLLINAYGFDSTCLLSTYEHNCSVCAFWSKLIYHFTRKSCDPFSGSNQISESSLYVCLCPYSVSLLLYIIVLREVNKYPV